MIKYYIIIFNLFFPVCLFAQFNTDTIVSDSVIIRKIYDEKIYYRINDLINPIDSAIIIQYQPDCAESPKCMKVIKNGRLVQAKHFRYYAETCKLNEVFYVNEKGYREGVYEKWYSNGLKQIDGQYNNVGNKVGIFTFFNFNNNYKYYKIYNISGKRIIKFDSEDSLKTNLNVKNFISIDLFCLQIKELKLVYERYLGERHLLKLESDFKPSHPQQGTMIFDLFSYNDPYIYIVPRRYLFSIEHQNIFGYSKYHFYLQRHPFYVSYGLYYLKKSYDKIIFHYIMGDDAYGNNYDCIKSEFSDNYGMRILLGKKEIFGKVDSKINQILDCFIGIGYCYSYNKSTVFGKSRPTTNSNKEIVMYTEPEVMVNEKLIPSFFIGFRLGLGW